MKRIQRSRQAKLPRGAVVVSRPTKWGNPFEVGAKIPEHTHVAMDYMHYEDVRAFVIRGEIVPNRDVAVRLFRAWIAYLEDRRPDVLKALVIDLQHAQYLACWCPLSSPCHADAWIEICKRKHEP